MIMPMIRPTEKKTKASPYSRRGGMKIESTNARMLPTMTKGARRHILMVAKMPETAPMTRPIMSASISVFTCVVSRVASSLASR